MDCPRDEDDWEALYRRVYPRLLAYAQRRLDADRARDAVSETMTRAVARISSYRPMGSAGIDGWLFGICRHVVIDAQRAAARSAPFPASDSAFHNGASGAVDHGSPLDGLVSADEAAAVRRAFERLRDDERELLELRVVGGLSADDTAVALGKRAGAVRMAQSRALARLRSLLEEDGW